MHFDLKSQSPDYFMLITPLDGNVRIHCHQPSQQGRPQGYVQIMTSSIGPGGTVAVSQTGREAYSQWIIRLCSLKNKISFLCHLLGDAIFKYCGYGTCEMIICFCSRNATLNKHIYIQIPRQRFINPGQDTNIARRELRSFLHKTINNKCNS